MFSFVVKHLFQSEEIFSGLLVQFLINVSVYLDEFWNDNVLESVHTSVGHLDLLIKC